MSLPESSGEEDLPTPPSSAPVETTAPRQAFNPVELLARIWQQNLPLVRDRLAFLDRASQQTSSGQLAPEMRVAAAEIAHKLAGSLGMFGFPKGTEIARELEELLESDSSPDPERFSRLTGDLRAVLGL